MSFQVTVHFTDGDVPVHVFASFPVALRSFTDTVTAWTRADGSLMPAVEMVMLTDTETQREILVYAG